MTTANGDGPRPLRILFLHGYTQSGPLFHAKTRALEKNLRKAFPSSSYTLHLSYPTAPIPIRAPDVSNSTPDSLAGENSSEESWGWFRRKDNPSDPGAEGDYVYQDFDKGLERVAQTMREEGPFDGVVGFSQGGFMAGAVASLLEEGRREAFERAQGSMPFPEAFVESDGDENTGRKDAVFHPPLKFAVSYSGFGAAPNKLYDVLYEPKIKTPVLSFIGTMDTVVDEGRSMRLVDATAVGRDSEEGKRRIVYHPGGHFLPASQRQCLIPLLGFIRESMGWDGQDGPPVGKRAQEDLDLPF